MILRKMKKEIFIKNKFILIQKIAKKLLLMLIIKQKVFLIMNMMILI